MHRCTNMIWTRKKSKFDLAEIHTQHFTRWAVTCCCFSSCYSETPQLQPQVTPPPTWTTLTRTWVSHPPISFYGDKLLSRCCNGRLQQLPYCLEDSLHLHLWYVEWRMFDHDFCSVIIVVVGFLFFLPSPLKHFLNIPAPAPAQLVIWEDLKCVMYKM